MDPTIQEELLAEITALKITMQHAIGAIGILSGKERAAGNMEALRAGAIADIPKNSIIAPGLDQERMAGRIEASINSIFDSVRVIFRE